MRRYKPCGGKTSEYLFGWEQAGKKGSPACGYEIVSLQNTGQGPRVCCLKVQDHWAAEQLLSSSPPPLASLTFQTGGAAPAERR